jgi:hypothetical protein
VQSLMKLPSRLSATPAQLVIGGAVYLLFVLNTPFFSALADAAPPTNAYDYGFVVALTVALPCLYILALTLCPTY